MTYPLKINEKNLWYSFLVERGAIKIFVPADGRIAEMDAAPVNGALMSIFKMLSYQ